jgi:fatty-acyl-CoA synthase
MGLPDRSGAPRRRSRSAFDSSSTTSRGTSFAETRPADSSADGAPGELIARLEDRSQFEGYSSEEATRSKLVEGAFEDGDLWYRSGDLFRTQNDYYYFVSRLGDTYRWKGENVSATEVANVIDACAFVAHATVYPVEVPTHEGAAGMALLAVRTGEVFDGAGLLASLAADLPPHAFPLFVRLGDGRGALTETYKVGLATLKANGYSLDRVEDPLFVLDASAARYVPLTEASLAAVGLPAFTPVETPVGKGK